MVYWWVWWNPSDCRTQTHAEAAIKSAERKAHQDMQKFDLKQTIRRVHQNWWFEKYIWFISSETLGIGPLNLPDPWIFVLSVSATHLVPRCSKELFGHLWSWCDPNGATLLEARGSKWRLCASWCSWCTHLLCAQSLRHLSLIHGGRAWLWIAKYSKMITAFSNWRSQ